MRCMKKVLIINTNQLGFLTDTLKYCEHLNKSYSIDFLCYDYGYDKVSIDGVHVTYVPHPRNRHLQGFLFLTYAIIKCLFYSGCIFVVYFPYCKYLKQLLFWKNMNLDIRTLSVSSNSIARESSDRMLNETIRYYDSVSYISEGVKNKLKGLGEKKSYKLPLGADVISENSKVFDTIKLLYVGTLNNRNIILTVKGLKRFVDENPQVCISYDIIGDGEEFESVCQFVKLNQMTDYCKLHGRLAYKQLRPFFDDCNVGVSFVPITEYYNDQPPTKTFEYCLSGLLVIATSTRANREVVNNNNGLLIYDTEEAFYNALCKLHTNYGHYDSEIIRRTMIDYSWDKLINKYLVPIINNGKNG